MADPVGFDRVFGSDPIASEMGGVPLQKNLGFESTFPSLGKSLSMGLKKSTKDDLKWNIPPHSPHPPLRSRWH
jgi:hypothetical protein